MLADEPTANLDPHTGASIIELMRLMQEQYATTFVFSTHDRLLMSHADETFTIDMVRRTRLSVWDRRPKRLATSVV